MDFKSVLTSQPFTFIIGPEKKKFFVNEELISKCSPVLKALMGRNFREGSQREAYLDEVEEDTFVRFIQYAWTGTYDSPSVVTYPDTAGPDQKEKTSAPTVEFGSAGGYPYIIETRPSARRSDSIFSNRVPRSNFWGGIDEDPVSVPPPASLTRSKPLEVFKNLSYPKPPVQEKKQTEPLGSPFLCHAQLYVFADKYDIKDLKSQSSHNLHLVLADLITGCLAPKAISQVVELAEYVYTHTMDMPAEPLRRMLANYCAWNIKKLSENAEFIDYYEVGGPFTRDLLLNITKRLT
ncbi:hypothetical protein H072_7814 [Dactylellina haptotyla CBS 200.50]|uniref:BTB domain-containing protein n=1 Tax=Dactylellina haptotyla (strain CBS 200.50) TaxID=1284197 RepID=S8ABE9_DACHA|nr:hypothetical protein H072_7814 [Dactylellina haptotyla CBS 200.50]